MCGITGIFNLKGAPVSRSALQKMTDSLAHRGPDDASIFVEKGIGLGHRRLSILDTSAKGRQPMASKNGRWMIVFNGCIYNFQEIRNDLRARGYSFNSGSDTEVIVEALAEFGPKIFERFDGMFAIGAWDAVEKKLYLTRDRFGVKPLYYFFDGERLLFASEVKAIMAHPSYKIEVNLSALNEYFTFQNQFRYHTMFKDVHLLPPANTLCFDENTLEVVHNSWWDYDFSQPDESMTFEDAKNETSRLFREAVSRQMVADVPVGSYLSGGMDSGSITAIASELVPRLSTFTCGFDMSSATGVEANYDERRDAELMANHFKTEHFEQVMNAGDIRWSLPRVVWHLEDLRVGMSYPNYYISRLASKFVKVCLQGTGGDELFGGYPWRYYRVFQSLDQEAFFKNYYSFWQRLVPEKDKMSLFQPSVKSQIDPEEPFRVFKNVFTFNQKLRYDTPEDHIQNSLYFETKTFLHGLLLVGDKLAMANGLEERFPFLDNALVDFAQKIPVKHKLGNFEHLKRIDENEFRDKRTVYREHDDGKNVLRKAMTELIPESIINRKKQGFSAPDESWYRGENAAYVKELLLSKKAVSSEFINPDYIRQVVHEHCDDHVNHRLLIWSFLCFEQWCRIFLNGEKEFLKA